MRNPRPDRGEQIECVDDSIEARGEQIEARGEQIEARGEQIWVRREQNEYGGHIFGAVVNTRDSVGKLDAVEGDSSAYIGKAEGYAGKHVDVGVLTAGARVNPRMSRSKQWRRAVDPRPSG